MAKHCLKTGHEIGSASWLAQPTCGCTHCTEVFRMLHGGLPIDPSSFELWHVYPTAMGNCKCLAGAGKISLIILTQLKNVTVCGNCGTGYYIEGIAAGGGVLVKRVPKDTSTKM